MNISNDYGLSRAKIVTVYFYDYLWAKFFYLFKIEQVFFLMWTVTEIKKKKINKYV